MKALIFAFTLTGCSLNGGGNICGEASNIGERTSGDGGAGSETTTSDHFDPCATDVDCADGDACTEDKCVAAVCAHTQTCSCPTECDPGGGLTAQKEQCNDGNPNTLDRCSAVDLCPKGECEYSGVRCDWLDPSATQQAVCNDGDVCTADYCEKDKFGPDLGLCRHDQIPDCAP